MKVVQELVSYFDRRGELSRGQLRRLLDQGFLAGQAPQTMVGLCDAIGATYYFRVQGAAVGSLWGTDTYTADSNVAGAALHAGLVEPGGTAIVKVHVVTPPAAYAGSVRHGVTSHDFGRYGSAFRLSAV